MINIFLGIISVIGLMFTGWYFVHPDLSQWVPHPVDEPDMFVEQIHAIKFGPEGQPLHHLSSTKLTHYPKGNKTVLTMPRLSISHQNQMPWKIEAEQGTTVDGTEILTLNGNIRMRQPAGPEHPARTVLAEELTYYPNKQFATTTKSIIMEQPGLRISATGMNAYIEKENLELLSDVKIRYHSEQMPKDMLKPKS